MTTTMTWESLLPPTDKQINPLVLGECPRWIKQTGADSPSLVFLDIISHSFITHDTTTHGTPPLLVTKLPMEVHGLAQHHIAGYVVSTNKGIFYTSSLEDQECYIPVYTSASHHTENTDTRSFVCNDCIVDGKGRFLTGSVSYDHSKHEESLSGAYGELLIVDNDATVRTLDTGVAMSNGLAFSPDQKTLYFVDSAVRTIWAFEYNLENGSVLNKTCFAKFSEADGIPDGLVADSKGNIFVAMWFGGVVIQLSPKGEELTRHQLPEDCTQPTAVALGHNRLYVTTAAFNDYGSPPKHPLAPTMYKFPPKIRGSVLSKILDVEEHALPPHPSHVCHLDISVLGS
eukprot:m.345694 g.345694  ORF g.345694 m.345694 type:complete len:343 (-) comp27039_c0_seq1:2-1030(-)